MPRARTCQGIEIEYECFGETDAPPMVLVMGFAMQMVAWDERFCEMLASRGPYRVVRFDNRDVGLSTKLSSHGMPDMARAMSGDRSAAPYSIEDMADDVVGLLDAIGAKRAHLAGVSMGGFIVQSVACRAPDRVASIASIMSSTGDRSVGAPRPEALGVLLSPPPMDREGRIEHAVRVWRAIRSPGFEFDEARIRDRTARAWDRDADPIGAARQMAAILCARDRTGDLGNVRVPAVVIHGTDDPLVTHSGGEATARAIPGAKLVSIQGLGHDLPEGAWHRIVDAIAANARSAA